MSASSPTTSICAKGPSKDHATKWIYQRAGLPVEITAEFETWRRIRDSEGAEGWVLHSLLAGKRTALVEPWKKDAPPLPLYAEATDASPVVARLAPGVIAPVKKCDGKWCRLKGDGYDGYLHPDRSVGRLSRREGGVGRGRRASAASGQ